MARVQKNIETKPEISLETQIANISRTPLKNLQSTNSIWKHLSAVNKGSTSKDNNLPDEQQINNECISDSDTIASRLNEYFSSIAKILNKNNTATTEVDLT